MQVHMMLLYCAIVSLFTFSLGTSGAPGFDNNSRCITSPAVVGGTGSMTFLFRQDLNMSSDIFHAYIIRTGDTANVLQCDRRKGTGITCDIINSAFEHTTIENYILKLTAANVTPELAGNYTLWILADGSKEPPVECNFVVKNKTKGLPQQASSDILHNIVVPVVVVLVLAVLIAGILILKRKNKLPCLSLNTRNTSEAPQALEENKSSEELKSLLETQEDVRGKLWYCLKTRKEDQHLLRFERNKVEGSFGIGRCPQKQSLYNLKVYHGKKPNCFRLKSSDNGFYFVDTERHFRTLSELVAFYRENDIIPKDTQTSVGKLVKPFERAPEGPWYVGKIESQEEDDVLLSEANGHGAFLIRESKTKNNAYTLAMNIEGVVNTYRITVEDEGYKLGDADGHTYFPTLSALVDYYKDNDLYVHNGTLLGRLSKPVQINEVL